MKKRTGFLKKVIGPVTPGGQRAIIAVLILGSGFLGMAVLSSMKKPPENVPITAKALQVETVTIKTGDEPVFMTAYGQTRACAAVPVVSEIPGKVIQVHPELEDGNQVKKGDLLFEIDSRDFEIVIRSGRERLRILNRIKTLAEKDYLRKKKLYEDDRLTTRPGVDAAEKAWLDAACSFSQLQQVVETAEMDLKRCRVYAPFDARISGATLEEGHYVSPGRPLFNLLDDTRLEIRVSLDSQAAGKWLQFGPAETSPWFSGLKRVPCSISWTESPDGSTFTGILDRVVRFDDKTRTLVMAVVVDAAKASNGGFPLIEGMFCKVVIPGKVLSNVARVPTWAVSVENTVYRVENKRLKSVPVESVSSDGNITFISGGIKDGDQLIVTRMLNPLENSLVHVIEKSRDGGGL